METPQLDRQHAARVMQQRSMIGSFVAYFAIIPLPLMLFGHCVWAALSLAPFAVYFFFAPLTFAPSREEVDDTMRDAGPGSSSTAIYVNGQYAGQRLNTDPAGQAAMDGIYGQMTGGDDGNVLSADAQLYGRANDMHRH